MIVREGELELDFGNNSYVERLDVQGKPLPEGMKLVDFLVEEEHRQFLIEVKDPAGTSVPQAERNRYIKSLQNNELINHELTPKARDSYTYLHLMKKDHKPMLFVFLLGFDSSVVHPASFVSFKDRLLARIRKEAEKPWERNYIQDCIVVNIEDWMKHFPEYSIQRVP
jgi:hypothetical protein